MTAAATVSTAYVQSLLDYVTQHGGAVDDLLAAAGVTLPGSDGRIGAADFAALFDAAETLLDEPDIGLRVGATIKPGHYGVLGYVAMSCATLGEAIKRHLRYQQLVADIGQATVTPCEHGLLQLTWQTAAMPTRHLAEQNLAGWVSYARWITGTDLDPVAAWFPHAHPASTALHDDLFRCPIRFDADTTALQFPSQYLGQRLVQADAGLRAQMDRYAQRLLGEFTADPPVVAQVRAYLRQHLSGEPATLAGAAAAVGVSARTLQRRLTEHDWTFNRLLDDTRRTLARQWVADPDLPLTEVAFLMGFTDASAFNHAFRRWFGTSPGAFRREASDFLAPN